MRSFLSIILILLATNAFSQEYLDVEAVHERSLEYFEEQQWRKLIRLGEEALKQGIESYLLRVRIGIAYYELEEYANAIPHLRKAVSTGYSDGITKEHLYYSYLQMGREEDANDVFFDMTDTRQRKNKPLTNDFIYDATGAFSFGISNDGSKNSEADLDGSSNAFGEQVILGDQIYFDAGLSQLPLRWLKIRYAFSYLNSNRTKQFMSGNASVSENYTHKEGHLYNEFSFRADEGFVISPSGHYVNIKETLPTAVFDSASTTSGKDAANGNAQEIYYSIGDSVNEQKDFVLSVTFNKWISVFKAGLSASFSYLNGEHQTQYGAALSAFPFSRNVLYAGIEAVFHSQNSVTNVIISPSAGVKITEAMWAYGFASFGRMNNYNEMNGFIVYNNPDVITLKYGAELRYNFPFNMSASLSYNGQQREKKYLSYELSGFNGSVPVLLPVSGIAEYSFHQIQAGLRYNF